MAKIIVHQATTQFSVKRHAVIKDPGVDGQYHSTTVCGRKVNEVARKPFDGALADGEAKCRRCVRSLELQGHLT